MRRIVEHRGEPDLRESGCVDARAAVTDRRRSAIGADKVRPNQELGYVDLTASIPSPRLPETTSPLPSPPMNPSWLATMPTRLGTAVDPSAASPIRFPQMLHPTSHMTPPVPAASVLPEMTLPAPCPAVAVAPPIVTFPGDHGHRSRSRVRPDRSC